MVYWERIALNISIVQEDLFKNSKIYILFCDGIFPLVFRHEVLRALFAYMHYLI